MQANEIVVKDDTELADVKRELAEKEIRLIDTQNQLEDSKGVIARLTNEKIKLQEELDEYAGEIQNKPRLSLRKPSKDQNQQEIERLKRELEEVKNSHTIKTSEVQLEIEGDSNKAMKDLILENNQLRTQIQIMMESDSL